MDVAKNSILFHTTALFAEYTSTPVTDENAPQMLATGLALLHYSPEPKVIRKVIDAAQRVGNERMAAKHRTLMKVAFKLDIDSSH